jgi:hypothetical protein
VRGWARAPAILAVLTLAACASAAISPPPPASTPGGTPAGPPVDAPTAGTSSSVSPSPVGAPGSSPSPSGPAGQSASASPGAGLTRDDSLLAILPPDLDGVPVTAEEASFAEAARDPAFARNVEKAAFAIVVGPGPDLASGVVATLAPGVFDDAFFRDWRDTYNAGACAQAGGIVGNAEAELDGRTVYITSCGGGLRVYHTYLEERDALVSLFSLGDARFGERLMADLRP